MKLNTMDRALLYIAALAIVLFPILTAGDVGSCNCLDISLENRSPCGFPGIPFDICKAAGCCYDPRYSGVPTCYNNQLVVNQQQDQRLKEQQDLDELCRKCSEGLIQGVLGALFGSNKSPDCDKCNRRRRSNFYEQLYSDPSASRRSM